MDRTQVARIMAELGEGLDLLFVAEEGEPAAWTLVLDEETLVVAEHAEARGIVTFTGLVAVVPEDQRARVYPLLLLANSLAGENDGLRLGTTDMEGEVCMAMDIADNLLTLDRLRRLFTEFIRHRRSWNALLLRGPETTGEDRDPLPLSDSMGIRI